MSAAIEKSVITMLQGEHAWIKTTSNHHVYHEFKNYKLWFKIKVTGIERSGQNIDFSKLTTEERIQKSKNFYYMSVDSF